VSFQYCEIARNGSDFFTARRQKGHKISADITTGAKYQRYIMVATITTHRNRVTLVCLTGVRSRWPLGPIELIITLKSRLLAPTYLQVR